MFLQDPSQNRKKTCFSVNKIYFILMVLALKKRLGHLKFLRFMPEVDTRREICKCSLRNVLRLHEKSF